MHFSTDIECAVAVALPLTLVLELTVWCLIMLISGVFCPVVGLCFLGLLGPAVRALFCLF